MAAQSWMGISYSVARESAIPELPEGLLLMMDAAWSNERTEVIATAWAESLEWVLERSHERLQGLACTLYATLCMAVIWVSIVKGWSNSYGCGLVGNLG